PEALPVDDPRAVAEVEDVAGIERAMHQVRSARLWPRLRQHPDQLCGGGSQRGIVADDDEAGGPVARAIQHARRIQSRPELYRERRGAPYPTCGQFSGAFALSTF